MEEKELEALILGLDENPTAAWTKLQASAPFSGSIIMPGEEVERRKQYKTRLKNVLIANGITPEGIHDPWLAGKIKRILRG